MAKSTGSKFWKVLVGILVALLILIIVAELGLRWFIGQQLRSSFEEENQARGVVIEEDPTISFGATPLVFSLLGQNISEVEMTTPSTLDIRYPDGPESVPEILGTPAATIDLEGLDISDPDNPVAAHMVTTTELPDDMILAMIQESTAGQAGASQDTDYGAAILQQLVRVTDVTANPENNALDVEFTGGAAVLSLEPVVEGEQLRFNAVNAALFGFDLPEQVSQGISTALEQGMQGATDELGAASGVSGDDLGITEFTVIDGGVRVSIQGTNIPLGEVSGTTQNQG